MSMKKSELHFKQRASGKRAESLAHATIHATSKTFAWAGLYAEVGENEGWAVDDLVFAQTPPPIGAALLLIRH
jgi:hypothetical protein